MPNQPPRSVEAEAERMFRDELDAVLERLGAELEPPLDAKRVSEPKKAALWGLMDPRVDPTLFSQKLQSTGFGPEDLQAMLLVQENPELAEILAQPLQDPEAVADLTELARYPFRLGMYKEIADPDERTREAERIHRGWMRSQGHAVEEPDDEPAAAPQQMGGY